jgi:nucleoside-diphosphate-sugar epimerase
MEMELFDSIWKLSKESEYRQNRQKLTELTEELIQLYEGQGRLSDNPLTPSRERSLSLPLDRVAPVIKNKICLITGGLGCVGSALIKELVKFDPKLIVIVDIRDIGEKVYQVPLNEKIVYEKCSILDFPAISGLFDAYQPQIVFHTAAQRDPGLAESQISLSVKTNVLGTWNLLSKVKQSSSVEQFVFSSTGKASRYYTKEIYSASKKICEMLVDLFSKSCPQKYFSMVRFTHIVDNSLMDIELSTMAKNGEFVAIHSPGKYVTAQNVKEAAYLMLNGLIYAEREKSKILLVKNLEWPVESLEVALYYLKMSKRKIPIVFIGNPKGYGEKFFRGQFDWSYPGDLNLLLNVYENRTKEINEAKDIIISSIIPFESSDLLTLVELLQEENSDSRIKEVLIEGLRKLFIGSLEKVDKGVTLEILKWGIDPKFLLADKINISDFGEMVSLMINSLTDTVFFDELEELTDQSSFS